MRNGHIKRITDQDIQSFVLEIVGTNVSTTYITCPAGTDKCFEQLIWANSSWNLWNSDPKKTLGIKLPYLVMIIKNMKKYFTFEVQVRQIWIKTAPLYLVRTWKETKFYTGLGRQECAKEVQSIKLSIYDQASISDWNLNKMTHISGSSLSSAQCQWGLMMAGTRSRWRNKDSYSLLCHNCVQSWADLN